MPTTAVADHMQHQRIAAVAAAVVDMPAVVVDMPAVVVDTGNR
jgi:hypothetical protein